MMSTGLKSIRSNRSKRGGLRSSNSPKVDMTPKYGGVKGAQNQGSDNMGTHDNSITSGDPVGDNTSIMSKRS